MKKIVLLVFVLGGYMAHSQSSKVVSAYNYLKYGQLKEAKEAIDAASIHEKTMNLAKTWWYKGQVYHAISDSCMYGHKSTKQNFCNLAPNAADDAFKFYFKALTFNFKDPKWHSLDIINNEKDQQAFALLLSDQKNFDNSDILADLFMSKFPALSTTFINKGVGEYMDKNIEMNKKAISSFENSLLLSGMVGKVDTPIFNYYSLAAFKAKEWDKAIEGYEQLIGLVKNVKFNKVSIGMPKSEVLKMMGKPLPPDINASTKLDQFEYNDGIVVFENGIVKEIIRTTVTYYYQLAACYKQKGDTSNFISTLYKGIEKFTDSNNDLISEVINYYIETKKTKEALDYLNIAISKSPENYTFYYAQGSLYDELLSGISERPFCKIRIGMKTEEVKKVMGEPLKKTAVQAKPPAKSEKFEYQDGEVIFENGIAKSIKDLNVPTYADQIKDIENKAIQAYTQAIKLKPDYFEANYNLGALYFNKGVRFQDVANELTDNKLFEEEKKKADEQFKLSIPNLEKAYELNPDDQGTVSSLKTLYFRMRNETPEFMEKYNKIEEVIKSQKK